MTNEESHNAPAGISPITKVANAADLSVQLAGILFTYFPVPMGKNVLAVLMDAARPGSGKLANSAIERLKKAGRIRRIGSVNGSGAYQNIASCATSKYHGDGPNRMSILAQLTRLRRFCCHPSLVLPNERLPSAKMEALVDLLENLRESSHRALVFSQFTDYLAIVRKVVAAHGWSHLYLDGSTPTKERERLVGEFQGGEGDFFLISLKAGGTGLNLTAADYVILLDPWWNPAVENQAADRAHRIGQTNPVTVYRLIASNTIEERVIELHREKKEIAEDVLDSTGSTSLTPAQLMRLFAPF